MDRRSFLVGTGAVLLAAPLAAEAQQRTKVHRVGYISTTSGDSSTSAAFRQRLRELGYVEGQNTAIEWRWGRGSTDRFSDFAAELVRLKMDVIVAANSQAGRAAHTATKTIPIVIAAMSDPVADGFVTSLSRPGGNVTGLTNQGPELQGKRLQLFKEVIPSVSRVALLVDTNERSYQMAVTEAETAARRLGLHLRRHEVSGPSELNGAFATMTKEATGAIAIVGGTMFYANRARLAEQALKSHLPMMCDTHDHAASGCLMSYGPNLDDLFRRAAEYVDKILKGTKPADLPVEQPTKFELVINLKTAKALGLTVPRPLLLRADEVIQ